MRIEQLPFANSEFGRRVIQVVDRITTAAMAAQNAYSLHGASARRQVQPATAEAMAAALTRRVINAGAAARSAPVPQRELQLGAWKPFNALHSVNPALQAAMRTREARQAKTTSGAGIEPTAFAPYPEISPLVIADAYRRSDVTGWCDRKCDIGARYLRGHAHLGGVDRSRRSYAYKAPFRIRPRTSSPLSILVARAVKASWENCDGFRSSMGELGVFGATGFAVGELAWRDCMLSIPISQGQSVRVPSEVIASIENVFPRNIVFDLVSDRPYLTMGPGSYVDITEPGLQKFLYIKCDGSGPARSRGYQWATDWLCLLAGMSLEKFGTLIEVFGNPTPFLQTPSEGFLSDDEHAHAIAVLERLGTAQPEVIPHKYGTIGHTPVPSGIAPLHSQILGYLDSSISKAVQSATLQTESTPSGVGSNALGEVHRNVGVDIQRVDGALSAEAIRTQPFRWLCEANAETWAGAFGKYVGGCSPADIVAEVPLCEWIISDETPQQRLATFVGFKTQLGFLVDEEQVREELGIRAPMPEFAPVDSAAPAPAPAPAAPADPAPTTETPNAAP